MHRGFLVVSGDRLVNRGERGTYLGSAIVADTIVLVTQQNEKKIMPMAPALWDPEIDSEAS